MKGAEGALESLCGSGPQGLMQNGDSLAEAMKRITSKRRAAITSRLQEALDF